MPIASLGELEHQVMLALLRQRENGYTVPIVLELERRTGREVAPAAVYITLRRLEQKGMLISDLRMSVGEAGSRERRYFALTPAGRTRLYEAQQAYIRLWEGLDLEPEKSG